MKRKIRMLAVVGAYLALAGCATNPFLSVETSTSGRLSEETVLRHASAGPLEAVQAQLILGNDAAFRSKLEMVEGAKLSIDAAYYIYSDDYSSSVLTEALIKAAQRGVRVRLLVDYHTNYKHLDLFTMMEKQARGGPDHDVTLIREQLGKFPLVGFFGNGEFAPIGRRNFFHTYTGALVVFPEDRP